jgi:hypothetical protein
MLATLPLMRQRQYFPGPSRGNTRVVDTGALTVENAVVMRADDGDFALEYVYESHDMLVQTDSAGQGAMGTPPALVTFS